jgi:DNA-binding NarL/FixJ family response regulator
VPDQGSLDHTTVNIVILTPVRLLAEGLAACFQTRAHMSIADILSDISALDDCLKTHEVDLVLIDVTHGVDLDEVRSVAAAHPDLSLVALGLIEQRQDVIRCGRAGFTGYIPRDANADALCKALTDVVHGRLSCPAEISCGLLRALFRAQEHADTPAPDRALTPREGDVLHLIGQGYSNKEIARELYLSVATVKHHVHNVLEKLNLTRRAEAMRRVRDAPWIASAPSTAESPKSRQ